MKRSSINIEYRDPIKEIKDRLQRDGARNIDIRRNYSGDIEVRYTIKSSDPEKDIAKVLENSGAKSIRISKTYSGARCECLLDDIVNEHEFKRKLVDSLKKCGFRAN